MKQKKTMPIILAMILLFTCFDIWGQEIISQHYEGEKNSKSTEPTIVGSSRVTMQTMATLPYTQEFTTGFGDCSTISSSGATKEWTADGGDASMNGYNSGDLEEDWLILPSFNFDNYTYEYMTFDSWFNYGMDDADNYLKLMYSVDYAGDPSTANWSDLSYTAPSTNLNWSTSGNIDLNSITGTDVVIAFKYHYNSGSYRYWEIDNISILERQEVTFQVDMSEETVSGNGVHIAGSFDQSWWDPSGIEMTDPDADGIYTVTLDLFANTEYQFKYINGNDWADVEVVPDACQGVGGNNRTMTTGTSNETLDVVCFSSCTSCNPPWYDVVFQVDMENETVVDGVFIAGTFNSWTPNATAMSLQSGSTTIYEVTISLQEGSVNEYKFINGLAAPNWEVISGGCTNTNSNREITVPGQNSTQSLVCFAECDICNPSYDITFQVNMMYETVSGDGVYIAGSFTNWGTGAVAMTNLGHIWSATVSIMGGSVVEYKFVNGNPNSGGAWEDFSGACVSGTNRVYTVPNANTINDHVCFNSCDACAVPELLISEVVDPDDNYEARFVELYNASSTTIDFDSEDWYIVKQANGGTLYDYKLSGSIVSGGKFVYASSSSVFTSAYGFTADQTNSQFGGNGDDGYYLYYMGDEISGILVDAFGVLGEDGSGKAWEYLDTKAVRLRSVTAPNPTWTASEWDIPGSADAADMTPFKHKEDITWQGTTDNSWNSRGNNWSGTVGSIPDASFNVVIPSTGVTNYPTISAEAACNNLTIQSGSGGDGSLMGQSNLTIYGNITTQRYISNGKWHGVSSPLDGATAQSLYSNTANVYLKYHTESTNLYTNITSLSTDLGDMKGWMMWYDGSGAETFDITGTLRSGTVGASDNLVRTADGNNNGWNFVGNPFNSAIDWDASSGWTKTNVGSTIYLYNSGNWATWNGSTGTNGGTRNIAMGQGFFVEVPDGQTNGTLTMSDAVQVHSNVGFMKSHNTIDELVRLEVSNDVYTDETVIYFNTDATEDYDYQFDAHKLFSFNHSRPQIYSTANDFMSINVLPIENTEVPIDVIGSDGENMSITATEIIGFGDVFMLDNHTGVQTNLAQASYEFTYYDDITNRFLVFFTTVGKEEEIVEKYSIFSNNKNICVIIPQFTNADVAVYNIMGQKIVQVSANGGITNIPIFESGYYIVKVIGKDNVAAKKVFIK